MTRVINLRDLVNTWGWRYGALWSVANGMTLRELVWADKAFEANPLWRRELEDRIESLFTTSYNSFSFAPGSSSGSGYAAKILKEGQFIWLNGTDVIIKQSNSSAQAQFFKLAGVQTLLCIPCFNFVVELGSSSLIHWNQKLLTQIRESLLDMLAPNVAATAKQQLQLINAFSPVEGPLLSQGHSVGSDDASFNGGVNHDQQDLVECSSSLPLEASMPEVFRSSLHRSAAAAAGNDLSEDLVVASGESRDWRYNFDLQQRFSSTPSSRRSLEQQLHQQDREVVEEADFSSSFLISPRQQMPLLSQLHYNQTMSSSQSSSRDDDYNGRSVASKGKQRSNKSSAASVGFVPWKATAQTNSPEGAFRKSSRQSNQVVLQRLINMAHQIPHVNSSLTEKQRPSDQQAIALMKRSAAAATEEAADDVLAGHQEAAVNHMIAERKRRQKQKENFAALRILIPFVSKMDRASILEDAIRYVKQLTSRVQELEVMNRELEAQIPHGQRKRSRLSGGTVTSH